MKIFSTSFYLLLILLFGGSCDIELIDPPGKIYGKWEKEKSSWLGPTVTLEFKKPDTCLYWVDLSVPDTLLFKKTYDSLWIYNKDSSIIFSYFIRKIGIQKLKLTSCYGTTSEYTRTE